MTHLLKQFKDKTILVTGGTGSIGSGLVQQLLQFEPKQVRVFSRDESKQYELLEHLQHPKNLRMLIGDVRDKDRLNYAMRDVDIVFHAAALKHVPFCEYNPFEAVKTNILGSQNVIDAALANEVDKVIGISTDKSANPVNVLGTSKLMMEKLFINANYHKGSASTQFACVRFGNVSWSRGSVLQLWKNQAERNKEIKVTDGDMTRFFMSTRDAADLVLQAVQTSKGSEVFIFKMSAIKLLDLAQLFINKYFPGQDINIKIIGNRGGEKMYEDLLVDNDVLHANILEDDKMFIIIPKIDIYSLEKKPLENYPGFREFNSTKPYSSNNHIDIEKIKSII